MGLRRCHRPETSEAPYYKPIGYPGGVYRVGPLARLNVVDMCGTPVADRELAEFRQRSGPMVHSAFHYHYARLIELLHGLEKIELLLGDPEILSNIPSDAAGKKWVRFAAWDSAGNGAFTRPVHLK